MTHAFPPYGTYFDRSLFLVQGNRVTAIACAEGKCSTSPPSSAPPRCYLNPTTLPAAAPALQS